MVTAVSAAPGCFGSYVLCRNTTKPDHVPCCSGWIRTDSVYAGSAFSSLTVAGTDTSGGQLSAAARSTARAAVAAAASGKTSAVWSSVCAPASPSSTKEAATTVPPGGTGGAGDVPPPTPDHQPGLSPARR